MGNTNFNTVIQMPNIVNDLVKQAVGRDAVSAIDMDYVTVAQNQKEVNHSIDFTSSANFENNNELPMGINVKIAPVQEGTGDPSSENIRPITGFTSANVIDDPDYGGFITWNQLLQNGNFADNTVWNVQYGTKSIANNELTYTTESIGSHYYDNQVNNANNINPPLNIPSGHVVFLTCETFAPYSNGFYMSVRTLSVGQSGVGITNVAIIPNTWNKFSKVTKGTGLITDVAFYWSMNTNYEIGDSVKLRNVFICDLTQMFGSTVADYIYSLEQTTPGAGSEYFRKIFPKDYYAYNTGTATTAGTVNGNTVRSEEIVFPDPPETVYGGTLNVNTGVLTVTMGEIASYNGETLPGVWMSDRDVYAAGTTPSEGAQVVYELAEPVTYQCTPEEIKSLIGNNHVFADTGDVSVSYTSYIPVI